MVLPFTVNEIPCKFFMHMVAENIGGRKLV